MNNKNRIFIRKATRQIRTNILGILPCQIRYFFVKKFNFTVLDADRLKPLEAALIKRLLKVTGNDEKFHLSLQ